MPAAPVLVLLVGPAAAGKSAVSIALVDRLRERGEAVARVELDGIAAMALPTLPDWSIASAIFASVVGQWMRTPLDAVVAEGIASRDEVDRVIAAVPEGARRVTVALTTPYPVALERALLDPTRGVTRDPEYLAGVYRRWEGGESAAIAADVTIDTSTSSIAESVRTIRAAVDRS